MAKPITATELMDIIDKWLHKEPASEWGYFEITLYDLLVSQEYYGVDQSFWGEDKYD